MFEGNGKLRATPVQARARRTVAHILVTAASLLDEVGVEDFNTNLLAERADVRVRTVYRYFPNKHAVILALAESMYERADASLQHTLAALSDPARPWWPAVELVIDDYFRTMESTPGWAAIRRALQAVPGLDGIRQRTVTKHAGWLADALRQRGMLVSRARAEIIGAAAFAAGSAIMEPALKVPPRRRKAVVDELKLMLRGYLARYLDE